MMNHVKISQKIVGPAASPYDHARLGVENCAQIDGSSSLAAGELTASTLRIRDDEHPDPVELAGRDSFPASDPPSWIGATIR